MPLPQPGVVQLESQPSPSTRLPSSHVSPGVDEAVAAPVGVQLMSQPSPFAALPSSHGLAAVTMPLPQPVGVQLASQPSPSTTLPSSQISTGRLHAVCRSRRRTLQFARRAAVAVRHVAVVALSRRRVHDAVAAGGRRVQLLSQPSPFDLLPSSQVSRRADDAVAAAGWRAVVSQPSPFDGVAVVALLAARRWSRCRRRSRDRAVGDAAVAVDDVAVVALLAGAVTMPLPHAGRVQLVSQPSPFARLPSSHCSAGRDEAVAADGRPCSCASQASRLLTLPSSHCLAGGR